MLACSFALSDFKFYNYNDDIPIELKDFLKLFRTIDDLIKLNGPNKTDSSTLYKIDVNSLKNLSAMNLDIADNKTGKDDLLNIVSNFEKMAELIP
jgi:hypothetical protein